MFNWSLTISLSKCSTLPLLVLHLHEGPAVIIGDGIRGQQLRSRVTFLRHLLQEFEARQEGQKKDIFNKSV